MALRVRDIITHGNVTTTRPDATVQEVNRLLVDHGVSGVPVVDAEGQVVGVVSQRNILGLIRDDLSDSGGFYESSDLHGLAQRMQLARDLAEKPVSEIMERKVRSITPDAQVFTAARMMRNLHVHRLLVLEEDGRLVGIIAAFDLLKVLESPQAFQEFYSVAT